MQAPTDLLGSPMMIITALQRESNGSVRHSVKLTDRGNVWRDGNWMTSVPGVFTAGDMQRGQSLIVWAIAEGCSSARGIDL